MKKTKQVQVEEVVEIVCDCCNKSFQKDDDEWHEIQSIEFVGGYFSIFGDGNTVAIDLCQTCLKRTLGQSLRING